MAIAIFLAWLHLFCGVTSENCHQAPTLILKLVTQAQNKPQSTIKSQSVPKSIKTISKQLHIKPVLLQTIGWSTCFALYDLPNVPHNCQYKETPGARPCVTQLFPNFPTIPKNKRRNPTFSLSLQKSTSPKFPHCKVNVCHSTTASMVELDFEERFNWRWSWILEIQDK